MQRPIRKYPRTRHLQGSRHQAGDTPDDKPLRDLEGAYLVWEEKLDGANAGLSFAPDDTLLLQSRGHYLSGGHRERHFALFKTWAAVHQARFHAALGARYQVYGEWLYAKHTCYYDRLSAYFFEFDTLDRQTDTFLSTAARRQLLRGLPIVPVPVLLEGTHRRGSKPESLLAPSLYRSPDWQAHLMEDAHASGSRPDMVHAQSDLNDLAEGLYVKVESGAEVRDRFKFVRGDFLQTIQSSDSHWQDRPILPNRLAPGIDIFAPETGVAGAYDDPSLS
jgi:hypothetical protein